MDGLGERDTDVLVVIDAQNDFCPGGALAVPGGDEIMGLINRLAERSRHVVLTQDWHPKDQVSFASSHGAEPFSTTTLGYGEQVLWPDHCVQGTPGADFHPAIAQGAERRAELIVRKGYNRAVDSYSAFYENDKATSTGLAGFLRERGFKRCIFVGLALDFCVRYSAEDALAEGFEAVVVVDATRAIDMDGSRAAALSALRQAGVSLVNSDGSQP
ncbi:MAG TPA: bifunctional nicotinamidase/pyrazinamidase [Phenylobacterium sp.]